MEVVVVMPPSDGKFAFGVSLTVDLLEFGPAVVFSGNEPGGGGSNVPGISWSRGSRGENWWPHLKLDVTQCQRW